MLTLHLEAPTLSDLQKLAIEALSLVGATAVLPLGEAPMAALNETPKATRKPKEPAADTTTASETQAQTEVGSAVVEAEASEPGELTYETHIKPAILDVSANHGGREAVLKLLGEFNVDSAKALTPEQWPALMAAVAALKAGA